MDYLYCVEERRQPIELPQLGIRCDEREIPHPIIGEASDYFVGMTQIVHSLPALDRFGEPTMVQEELKGLFGACVFGRKLAVIVRPGMDVLASCWLVLDLAVVHVSPGVWADGVFKEPPESVIIEAQNLTMKIVEPERYVANGEPRTHHPAATMDTLRRLGNRGWAWPAAQRLRC